MTKRLILTGHPATAPGENEPYAYLGPWCAPDQQYPSPNFIPVERNQLALDEQDGSAIFKLCDQALPQLATYLNRLQITPKPLSFWKPYLTSWLVFWIGTLADRLRWLIYAEKHATEHSSLSVKTLICPLFNHQQETEAAYLVYASNSEDYNLALFSDILGTLDFENIDVHPTLEIPVDFAPHSKIRSPILPALKALMKHRIFAGSSIHIDGMTGFSFWDKFLMMITLDPLFLFQPPTRVKLVADHSALHQSNLKDSHPPAPLANPTTRLEQLVNSLTYKYLPDYLLKEMKVINPKRLWIGCNFPSSRTASWELAQYAADGGRWYSVQHGGGYGQLLFLPQAKFEYECSTGFVTWGWKTHGKYTKEHFIRLPSVRLTKLSQIKARLPKQNIVFIPTNYALYRCHFETAHYIHLRDEYFNDQLQLIERLAPEVRTKLVFRPYPHSYQSEQVKTILSKFPEVTCSRKQTLDQAIVSAKLIIVDYLGTTLIEALALNKPTLILLRKEHFGISSTTKPLFELLTKSKVLFSNPQDLAIHLNAHWPNIEKWWNQAEVQSTIQLFCEHQAYTASSWKSIWRRFLTEQLKTQPLQKKD